LLSGNVIS